jgi:hypothetical protein
MMFTIYQPLWYALIGGLHLDERGPLQKHHGFPNYLSKAGSHPSAAAGGLSSTKDGHALFRSRFAMPWDHRGLPPMRIESAHRRSAANVRKTELSRHSQ